MEFKYVGIITELINTVIKSESENMEKTVDALFECINSKHSIYTFGASHAGIMSEELYYRAGGLMLFNPIFAREIMLDNSPITLTSKMEQTVGYGTAIANSKVKFEPGDVLIVHSVSGRNPVGVELAMVAKEKGVKVVALTNVAYSKTVTSRHPYGLRLFELADIVIDNHGEVGDAAVEIDGMKQKVAPTSSVIACTVMNSILAALVQKLKDSGMENPPVFYSANIDGGAQLNDELYKEYKDSIHYKF